MTYYRYYHGVATFLSMILLVMMGTGSGAHVKMLQEEVFEGKKLGPKAQEIHINSNLQIDVDYCSPHKNLTISLYGLFGRGAIGVHSDASEGITAHLIDPHNGGEIVFRPVELNFFATEDLLHDDFVLLPFIYDLNFEPTSEEGVKVNITCKDATEIIAYTRDNYDFVVDAVVTEDIDGDDIKLGQDIEAEHPLVGNTPVFAARDGSRRILRRSNRVSFESSNRPNKGIKVKHDDSDDHDVALIDGIYRLPNGRKVRRTLVRPSKKRSPDFKRPRRIKYTCCDINDDGDIEITIPGQPDKLDKTYYRVDARLGLDVMADASGSQVLHQKELVDVTAMINMEDEGAVTVNGGWVRKAFDDLGLSGDQIDDDDFDVSLLDLVVSDPNDDYHIVGVKGQHVERNGIPKKDKNKNKNNNKRRRRLLKQRASPEEKSISWEMRVGRKPRSLQQQDQDQDQRKLQTSNHKKLLVHGYCSSGNPFPTNHFTNAVAFDDGSGGSNNWSHDLFARKIRDFADNNGIVGCGCIGHSQGGAACLHLYTYYWSCLDNANLGGNRLIQTVGTPFQGSPLAGNLASIGEVFGASCGSNNDLTTSGATSWLSDIPSWARSKVTYFTTTYEDKWWRYDYCHFVTDMILGGQEDGATEKSRGQLPGGNNGGNVDNQCHTSGMRDPDQTKNSGRNTNMNNNAKY